MAGAATAKAVQTSSNVVRFDQRARESLTLFEGDRVQFRVKSDYMRKIVDVYDTYGRTGQRFAGFLSFLQTVFESGLETFDASTAKAAYEKFDEYAGKLSMSVTVRVPAGQKHNRFKLFQDSVEKAIDAKTAATVIFYIGLERIPYVGALATRTDSSVIPSAIAANSPGRKTANPSVKYAEPNGGELNMPSSGGENQSNSARYVDVLDLSPERGREIYESGIAQLKPDQTLTDEEFEFRLQNLKKKVRGIAARFEA